MAIVVWSKTGNTRLMAGAIRDGAKNVDEVVIDMFKAYEFNRDKVSNYDIIALGCPAMGAETLEDSEFLPMYNDIKTYLKNKKVFLFGSYDWGDGKWMRDWVEDINLNGVILFREPIISKGRPSEEILLKMKEVGIDLARS